MNKKRLNGSRPKVFANSGASIPTDPEKIESNSEKSNKELLQQETMTFEETEKIMPASWNTCSSEPVRTDDICIKG
jgi:hypothetical protein